MIQTLLHWCSLRILPILPLPREISISGQDTQDLAKVSLNAVLNLWKQGKNVSFISLFMHLSSGVREDVRKNWTGGELPVNVGLMLTAFNQEASNK